MTRAEISVDSVIGDLRMKDNLKEWDFWIDPQSKIAYVRVQAFTETTTAELTKVVAGLQKAGMAGLVVDLRNNPGGLLRSAVEVSSLFLPEGKTVVSTKGRNNLKDETFTSRSVSNSVDSTKSYPLVILINRYSASASEIVAAALQDHVRAIIIGERSYGKGSVQNIIPMESGTSALKLTTASYWRPSGKNIHRFPDSKEKDEWGVSPNDAFEVKLSDEERKQYIEGRRDRDIILRPGQETKAADKKREYHDKVLERAVDHIKTELRKQAHAAPQAPQDTSSVTERRERQPVDRDGEIRVAVPARRDNQADRGS
jgi:carboxyl-terminal processing protease